MRYSDIDLQCEDIRWFGIDKYGMVFACTTAGRGYVPEFVISSREETELLEDYFMNIMQPFTDIHTDIGTAQNTLIEEAALLAKKGILSFDAADASYKALPVVPIRRLGVSQLPDDIRSIMEQHSLDIVTGESAEFTMLP